MARRIPRDPPVAAASLARRRRPRASDPDLRRRLAKSPPGTLRAANLSRHHTLAAVPVPRARLGRGLLDDRVAGDDQSPPARRGGHLPVLPARLDWLHQLLR